MSESITYARALDDQADFARVAHLATKIEMTHNEKLLGIAQVVLEADTYYLAPDFMDLVDGAAESLPDDAEITRSDFTANHGWITFGRPLVGHFFKLDGSEPEPRPLRGVFWSGLLMSDHLTLLMFEKAGGLGGYFMHFGPDVIAESIYDLQEQLIASGESPRQRVEDEVIECPCDMRLSGGYWERWFKAMWLLLSQGSVTDAETIDAPRAFHKRAVKAGLAPTIRVVRLPRHLREASGGEHAAKNWQSRWIVSGHWRRQPWGPQRSRIRPIWIAPYVKGPDDKPLKPQAHRLFVAEPALETADA